MSDSGLSLIVGLIVPLETQHGNKVMVSEGNSLRLRVTDRDFLANVQLTHFIWSAFHVTCLCFLKLPHRGGCSYLFIRVVWQPFQWVGGGRRGQSGFVNKRIKRAGNQQMEKLCEALPQKK